MQNYKKTSDKSKKRVKKHDNRLMNPLYQIKKNKNFL